MTIPLDQVFVNHNVGAGIEIPLALKSETASRAHLADACVNEAENNSKPRLPGDAIIT